MGIMSYFVCLLKLSCFEGKLWYFKDVIIKCMLCLYFYNVDIG